MFCVKIVQIQKLQETLDRYLFIYFFHTKQLVHTETEEKVAFKGQ